MGKYRVDRKELSRLMNTVEHVDLRDFCELRSISSSEYVDGARDLLSRAEPLGNTGADSLALSLRTLGSRVLENYEMAAPKYSELYSGLVALSGATGAKRAEGVVRHFCSQVGRDEEYSLEHALIPAFYEVIGSKIVGDATPQTIDAALTYLESKSASRGLDVASSMLSYEQCFGPEIKGVRASEIEEVLESHPVDDHAASYLVSRFRLQGVPKGLRSESRMARFEISVLPGRTRSYDVKFPQGVPARLPAVLLCASEMMKGKRRT